MNSYKKKVDKIYKKINSLALKGHDNQLEYFDYINELISKGDYSYFEETLVIYYYIDISNAPDVNSYKQKSWDKICEQTKPNFLVELTKLYNLKGVYQLSFDIYVTATNQRLGQITETEVASQDYDYYVRNRQYARLIGEIKTYLSVKKESELESILIDTEVSTLSEEQNLLNRYKLAIDYLLS